MVVRTKNTEGETSTTNSALKSARTAHATMAPVDGQEWDGTSSTGN